VTLNAQMNSWRMSVVDRQVPTGNDAAEGGYAHLELDSPGLVFIEHLGISRYQLSRQLTIRERTAHQARLTLKT
jgi:hypothetical protein